MIIGILLRLVATTLLIVPVRLIAQENTFDAPASTIQAAMEDFGRGADNFDGENPDQPGALMNEIEVLPPEEITEVPTLIDKGGEQKRKEQEAKAKEEFDQLWQSSIKNEFGEADITNDVDVQDIVEPSSEYRYASFGKRDPFVPPFGRFQIFSPDKGQSRFEIAVVNSLQRPLDQLTVIGIWVTDNNEYRALIKVDDNLNFGRNTIFGNRTFTFNPRTRNETEAVVAKVGDPIGPAGKISKILDDRIETRQYSIEQDGTRKYEDVFLYLGNPMERQEVAEKRTIILGPGGEKIIKVESDMAGIKGGVRYLDAVSGADITEMYLAKLREENREKVGM